MVLGCGGTAEDGTKANDGNTGGTGNIDSGVPSATGGISVAYYGVRATGGNSTIVSGTGGTSAICPVTAPAVGSSCVGDITCNYGSIDCAYPCSAGCSLVSRNGAPIPSWVGRYFICSNGNWSIQTDGNCPTANDCQCGDAGAPDRVAQLTTSCLASGGGVFTSQCCTATGDFPRTCNNIGACSCGPGYTKETVQCECPPNGCFDGTSCVSN